MSWIGNVIIILQFAECNIIFRAQGKIILHKATQRKIILLSAIQIILHETFLNVIFMHIVLFLIKKKKSTKLIPNTSLEIRCV